MKSSDRILPLLAPLADALVCVRPRSAPRPAVRVTVALAATGTPSSPSSSEVDALEPSPPDTSKSGSASVSWHSASSSALSSLSMLSRTTCAIVASTSPPVLCISDWVSSSSSNESSESPVSHRALKSSSSSNPSTLSMSLVTNPSNFFEVRRLFSPLGPGCCPSSAILVSLSVGRIKTKEG